MRAAAPTRVRLVAPLLLAVLATVAVVGTGADGADARRWTVDLAEVALAFLAARTCAGRARHGATTTERWGWRMLSLGCASWGCGQGLWSWFELALGHETPFPSLADAGFLGFPPAVVTGLWLLRARETVGNRTRSVLDGLAVACAIGLVSWTTSLGAVFHAGGDSTLTAVVSLAYPAGDVVVLTMAVVAMSAERRRTAVLTLVSLGAVAMALSDSVFAYETATESFATGVTDLGWCAAFALLAVAGLDRSTPAPAAPATGSRPVRPLPYLVLALAGAVVLVQYAVGHRFDAVSFWVGTLLVGLVLVRQWTAAHENSRLLGLLEEREAQLRHRAFHDDLTGLSNRAVFSERVAHALALAERTSLPLTVGFLDLDGFKGVNDRFGHAAGDELLVHVARLLERVLRRSDTLARLGGDEFAVLLEACDRVEAAAVAAAVLEALRAPVALRGSTVAVSASIGMATWAPSGGSAGDELPSADALLRRADLAMYDVKRHGKNGVRLHDPALRSDDADDLTLHAALADALERREVRAVFQPVLALADDRVAAFEVLARWDHDGRAVPPPVFVGVAERTGLSSALTSLMLDLACAQLARWRSGPLGTDAMVAVNVTPAELRDPALPQRVLATLRSHGVPPHQLVLEVTESGILRDLDRTREVMAELRGHGIAFSLDDFGTGYSSLAQLLSIPLDSVKVDKLFVEDIDRDPTRLQFLESVIALAASAGLRVVAEGVERAGQLEVLRRIGCTWGQGYLLGRPVPADELPALPAAVTGVEARTRQPS
ncbi:diguanylate cyclase (GGDEF)-like protein [Motilibacter peucedani]|uniref:Diguanylate cyclase (GGDEF)-like protein n=1 Tax=Motilibacter peucedani TaxID=598650 RepID=A0A420XT19_9ACTN|nr:bifunctional diguanylate cyclase/phosphodiesterase [Motilibacter peucedani]RKS79901.1 diguanylate cyclase (GGDEF)-like protein [Motilibacter peucedani]